MKRILNSHLNESAGRLMPKYPPDPGEVILNDTERDMMGHIYNQLAKMRLKFFNFKDFNPVILLPFDIMPGATHLYGVPVSYYCGNSVYIAFEVSPE